MKAYSIHDIKGELGTTPQKELIELCLRLGKFKKENKELLSYLLFESHDEQAYIQAVKQDIDEQFLELPKPNLYLTKKTLRKIIRLTNKHIKYMAAKTAETELLMYICQQIRKNKIPVHKSTALQNLYNGLMKKVEKAISGLHEDLQSDFQKSLETLQ